MAYTPEQLEALRAIERAAGDAFYAGLPLAAVIEEATSGYEAAQEDDR